MQISIQIGWTQWAVGDKLQAQTSEWFCLRSRWSSWISVSNTVWLSVWTQLFLYTQMNCISYTAWVRVTIISTNSKLILLTKVLWDVSPISCSTVFDWGESNRFTISLSPDMLWIDRNEKLNENSFCLIR